MYITYHEDFYQHCSVAFEIMCVGLADTCINIFQFCHQCSSFLILVLGIGV